MSGIVIYEMPESMSGSITREQGQNSVKEVRRRLCIGQCGSFDHAELEIRPYLPEYALAGGSYWNRANLSIQPVGNGYFDVTATYRTLVPPDGGGGEGQGQGGQPVPGSVSWDTTGHTEHITQALEVAAYGSGDDPPSFAGAINVQGDTVAGLDVVRPSMVYSETWVLPISLAMSCTFLGNVYRLTGTVNADPFRCFEPGECLFLGARGQWQEDQPYVSVSFDFEARPNDPQYQPWENSDDIIEKKGWEYVWILYKGDVNADTLVKFPRAAYVCKVYREESWGPLLIAPLSIAAARGGIQGNPPAAGGGGFGN